MKTILKWLLVLCFGLEFATAAPIFESVTAFQAGPLVPENGTLLKHTNGFFYGTSRAGGAYGNGCLYRVNTAGEVSALAHFTGNTGPARGRRPQASLVDDGTGVLWGTTFSGGTGNSGDGFGTIFKFNPVSGDLTSVVQFTGSSGFAKGSFPQTALVRDGAGQLWGTTFAGGFGGNGTVFRVNPINLVFSNVLDFTGTAGGNRGKNPLGAIVHNGAGTLWGTTSDGGTGNNGTLFSITTTTGTLTTQVDFTGAAGAFPGSRPAAALAVGQGGSWWGTTSLGGTLGWGTVFRVTAAGEAFTKVVDFTGLGGEAPGRGPAAALAPDGSGGFWGTTNAGGAGDFGTIFRVNTATLAISSTTAFSGNFGAVPGMTPHAGLVPDGAGSFWGVTVGGGKARQGIIYKINNTTGAFALVADFVRTLGDTSGSNPSGGLTAGPDGLLWGFTEKGGLSNLGTIFTVNPVTGALRQVLYFSGTTGAAKGSAPSAELTSDGRGFLWGTTSTGGTDDLGTVFKINSTTKAHMLIAEFTGATGRNPLGRLVDDGVGNLWGTTSEGGTGFKGTVFKINQTTGSLTTVVHFTGAGGVFRGDGPSVGLVSDGSGFLWGTTYEGGTTNQGTIFKIAAATGAFSSVISFDGDGNSPGDAPESSLTLESGGFLYGVTAFGGSDDLGVIFKIHKDTGLMTRLFNFTGTGGDQPGSHPRSGLIQDPTGAWYGTTESGGATDQGTIFQITTGGEFASLVSFTGASGFFPGERPRGDLLRHSDGHFYATTYSGGALDALSPGGNGAIYRLRLGPIAVNTEPASSVAPFSAVLNGQLNPNGVISTVTFEYGTSPVLAGASIIPGGLTQAVSGPVDASATISGLLPSRSYYYRVRAMNAENPNLQFGAIRSFVTGAGTGGTSGNGFSQWLTGSGISGGANSAGIDSDHDGSPNAVEYVLGTHPALPGSVASPSGAVTGNNLVFTFPRTDSSETSDLSLMVEAGNSPSSWPVSYAIGATTATSSGGVIVEENGNAPDLITITIPATDQKTQFVRIKVLIAP